MKNIINLHNVQGPITAVREELQRRSMELAGQLARSVGRAASVDQVACLEYGDEVALQRQLMEELLFLQHCREALERAIHTGSSHLVWHWHGGSSTTVRFRRENHHIRLWTQRRKNAA